MIVADGNPTHCSISELSDTSPFLRYVAVGAGFHVRFLLPFSITEVAAELFRRVTRTIRTLSQGGTMIRRLGIAILSSCFTGPRSGRPAAEDRTSNHASGLRQRSFRTGSALRSQSAEIVSRERRAVPT
jgi:hypothetical protein